ncbi:Arginase family [Paraburkholderia caribensis MBA4]|uniref:Arginase family n=1 Tax=Paraburkholderia caribensis MBA4 TaxID=1323664 RepID=A0A0P0RI13_9BURK|nr:arginase family protein [Paraburkholderia caribensis]ALL68271.1 Arginase family [Paraburkholderia caribensis MBA4]
MSLSPVSTTFLGADNLVDPNLVETPYAFLGIPYGPPYAGWELSASADAADCVRNLTSSRSFTRFITHWNFDIGGPQSENGRPNVTDLGNVQGDVHNIDRIYSAALDALLPLVRNGIVPLVMGGLDSIPPMLVAPFQGVEDINVLQLDAHIDYRDEIYGRRDGYSSPMRRIRDFSCVHDLVQVGARSIGSARREEVEAALAAGNKIITAWDVHEKGAHNIAAQLELNRRWVICVDCDGMDPTIAPGVGVPEPGGLTFVQTATLIRHLAKQNRIAGIVFSEFQPARDVSGTTALTIIRLLLTILGIQRSPERIKPLSV